MRPDGREDLCALRPVSISAGTIGTADGSAVVKQGNSAFDFYRIFTLVFIFLATDASKLSSRENLECLQGDTVVVCGIKLELAPPKPEEPAKGNSP